MAQRTPIQKPFGGYDPVTGYPITQPKQQITENQLTDQQKRELKAKFDKYDTDRNGTLDKEEVKKLLEETLNRKVSDKLFDSYVQLQFNATDKNFNGVIEWEEFVSLYSKIYIDPELPIHMGARPMNRTALETGAEAPKIQRADTLEQIRDKLTPQQLEDAKAKFKQYDKDSSGTIDKEELTALLSETMSKRMAPLMVKRYVDAQFQMYDRDGSGSISLDEFLALYQKMFLEENKGLPVNVPTSPQAGRPPPGGRGVPMPGL